jgi:hypothetical protein
MASLNKTLKKGVLPEFGFLMKLRKYGFGIRSFMRPSRFLNRENECSLPSRAINWCIGSSEFQFQGLTYHNRPSVGRSL